MADMLVKLYDLPDATADLTQLQSQALLIHQGLMVEKRIVGDNF
jgi:hypothetical protein